MPEMRGGDRGLRIEAMKVADLVPYAGNAKLHPDKQVGMIAESIERYGFNDPIAVWENADGEMEIVEGHGRLLAAKRLGIEEVPCIRLDGLTDEQRRAYTLVHNKLTMNTGFDARLLMDELMDFDGAEVFGFDVDPALPDEETEGDSMVTCPRCGHRQEA